MKKLLYTTSALVGAAFLMEAVVPAKAEVNMSLRYRAALISQSKKDADKDKSIEAFEDDEDTSAKENSKDRATSLNSSKINIDITASKDHPNGLTTGASLAAATGAGKLDYDNAIGYISGSFGKVEVGDFHDVGYRVLGYGTPSTGNFGAIDAGFQPSGGYVNTSATGNIGKRASGIAYWSPSFSGAQVGISWHPQVTTLDDEGKAQGVEGKSAGLTSTHGDVEDSMGFVATYSGSFGGTGVSMGVSFENAKTISAKVSKATGAHVNSANDVEKNLIDDLGLRDPTKDNGVGALYLINSKNELVSGAASAVDGETDLGAATKTQDPTAFAGYVSFDIGQFSVGGSYGAWESPNTSTGGTVSESTAYALGASYSVDAITFGVGWGAQSTDNTHYNVRKVGGTVAAGDEVTEDQAKGATPFKQTLDNDILAFTVGYQLGEGAAIDFVIEQATAESATWKVARESDGTPGTATLGKSEVKSSGFGIGIDLKF